MPEMPEVEAVCRKLRPVATGRVIEEARILRCAPAEMAPTVRGRRVVGVDRAGKHILIRLAGDVTIHTHLRMSGNLFVIPDHRFASSRARVVLELDGGGGIVLEDARALARMEAGATAEIEASIADLGVEPLGPEFTFERFAAMARGSRQPAKLFLMDQTRVAGLGNIYVAEALFQARVDPRKPMQRLTLRKLRGLHAAIVNTLTHAVQSAVVAYSRPGGFGEAEEFPRAVYGREGAPCVACRRAIRRIAQGGRSTYYCPGCQR
ncbi:MAG: bifunctional DNA-formamidopyrimidine glycosylase/DNA-(apurinic or apyrimidinic site) lyase [Bryobacteraceae bacterium]